MKTVLACGQFAPEPGDAAANTATIRDQAREAASRGAALIVFPELCLSGYLEAERMPQAAVRADGREMEELARAAREAEIAICFGFAERSAEGPLYNSMAFLDAEGRRRSVYRKVHLWTGEDGWARPGSGFECFDAGPFRCGMWICYDTRFPEAARALALQGAEVGLVGAAWFGPAEEWELALRARALDNGMYAAGSVLQNGRGGGRRAKSRGAADGGAARFNGTSLITDPHGRVLARAGEGSDVIFAEYDSEEVQAFRTRLPLLQHRRPDAYAGA
jgi:predicted amidohydrolase